MLNHGMGNFVLCVCGFLSSVFPVDHLQFDRKRKSNLPILKNLIENVIFVKTYEDNHAAVGQLCNE